jgi:hypothetical protein
MKWSSRLANVFFISIYGVGVLVHLGCGSDQHVWVPGHVEFVDGDEGGVGRFAVFERRTLVQGEEPSHLYLTTGDEPILRFECAGVRLLEIAQAEDDFVTHVWATQNHLYLWRTVRTGEPERWIERIVRFDIEGNYEVCADISNLQDDAQMLAFLGRNENGTFLFQTYRDGETSETAVAIDGSTCVHRDIPTNPKGPISLSEVPVS